MDNELRQMLTDIIILLHRVQQGYCPLCKLSRDHRHDCPHKDLDYKYMERLRAYEPQR